MLRPKSKEVGLSSVELERERQLEWEIDSFVVPDELSPSSMAAQERRRWRQTLRFRLGMGEEAVAEGGERGTAHMERRGDNEGDDDENLSDLDSRLSDELWNVSEKDEHEDMVAAGEDPNVQQPKSRHIDKIPAASSTATAFDDNPFKRNAQQQEYLQSPNSDLEGQVHLVELGSSTKAQADLGTEEEDLDTPYVRPLMNQQHSHLDIEIGEDDDDQRLAMLSPTPKPMEWEEGDWADGVDIEEMVMYGDARQVREVFDRGHVKITPERASELLLKCVESPDELAEPLETLMLLVDDLKADINSVDANGSTPLHSLFNRPLLGRFLVSRGADVLAKDANGESALALCIEYGYDYIVPSFVASGGEAVMFEDKAKALDYAITLVTAGGYGSKVAEMVNDGLVHISSDLALELLDQCRGSFDTMKEPVETFQLLERIILEG